MRGNLPDDKLQEIADRLPTVDDRLLDATQPGFGQQINDFVNDRKLGIALVCLGDAGDRFNQVRTSLSEAYACLAWYREFSSEAPLEIQAISTCKYYVDYATLLLYATAEDISFFIIHFLGVEQSLKVYLQEPETQKKLERKNISSNAGKVGIYLVEKLPSDEITKITTTLHKNPSQKKALDYRNTWVHSKPPIVSGLGIQYARKSAVVTLDDGTKTMYFGGGDPHEYTIDELLHIVHSAAEAFAKALSDLVKVVISKREETIGEKFDFQSNSISIILPNVHDPK